MQQVLKNKSTSFTLASLLNKYIFFIVLSCVFSCVAVLSSLYIPIIVGESIDLIIDKEDVNLDLIFQKLFIVLICACLSGLFSYLQSRINNRTSANLSKRLKNDLIQKINQLPLSFLDKTPNGEIHSIMISDIDQACEGINLSLNQFITGVLTICFTLVFMFMKNVYLSIVVVVLTPLSLLVSTIVSKNIYQYFKKQSISRGKLSSYCEEIFEKEKTVKSNHYEETSIKRFEKLNDDLSKISTKAVFYSSCVNPTTRLVNNIIYACVILIASILINQNSNVLSIGALSTFLFYSTQYAKPFNEISSVISELSNSFACLNRVKNILNIPNDIDEGKETILEPIQTIEFNNIHFSYNENTKLIENFTLNVKEGKHVAIVGHTGSGKTTLINLLLRFYDVNQGTISLNGIPIKTITKENLRSHFGLVLQDTWLKNSTIKENLFFGNETKTEDELFEACKITKADSFIRKLPNGYDTYVSNNDESISIGEKQLICITRVLLNNPEILILDEATSNIDLMTEKQIQQDIDLLMKDKTAFVVAHRLSTIIQSDIIVVMKNGHVEGIGTHEELLEKNDYYHELFMSQFN